MSVHFLEPTSQPLFREEHGRALHLEVVLLSAVGLKLGRRQLPELALRLRLGLSLLLPRREIALPLRVRGQSAGRSALNGASCHFIKTLL